jgi:hypothetical protein
VTLTYFLLEVAYTILIHSEAVDAWSSQAPEKISGEGHDG